MGHGLHYTGIQTESGLDQILSVTGGTASYEIQFRPCPGTFLTEFLQAGPDRLYRIASIGAII